MINSDVTKLAVSILDSEAKWQLMKSEVNRLAKLRDEAIDNFNKAVMLKDELTRPSPNELELAKYVTLVESREGDISFRIRLKDPSKEFSINNILIDDSWIRELFGQDAKIYVGYDSITFYTTAQGCPKCEIYSTRPRGAKNVITNKVSVFGWGNYIATCVSVDNLIKILEEIRDKKE